MAPTTPPTLEDSQELPPEQPPTNTLGPTLDSLTTAEISQDCQDIVSEILQEAVMCSENGTHGQTGPQTSCVSAACSLGGVSTPQDITLALSNLVSSNARYRRKTYYNCGQCQAVLRNTTACHCGNSIDFPANLFKKCRTKSLAFFTKLENTSNQTTTSTPKTQVSLHRWARYILSAHGVMFTGLLTTASGLSHKTTCSCFLAQPSDKPTLETENDESLALNISGSLYHSQEVGKYPKITTIKPINSALTPA